jgi:hypothetical protein
MGGGCSGSRGAADPLAGFNFLFGFNILQFLAAA